MKSNMINKMAFEYETFSAIITTEFSFTKLMRNMILKLSRTFKNVAALFTFKRRLSILHLFFMIAILFHLAVVFLFGDMSRSL